MSHKQRTPTHRVRLTPSAMVKFEQVGESWPDMEYDALYRNDDIFGELFEFEHPELGLLGTFWPTEVLVIETITTH